MSETHALGKLTKPTVGELIAFLSTLPADTPIRIEDADTGWTIEIIHVHQEDDGMVFLSGWYEEMDKSR